METVVPEQGKGRETESRLGRGDGKRGKFGKKEQEKEDKGARLRPEPIWATLKQGSKTRNQKTPKAHYKDTNGN